MPNKAKQKHFNIFILRKAFTMFDLHIHTFHSPDSKQTLGEICESALQKGLQGVAICDHVDMWFSEKLNTPAEIATCMEDVRRARAVYGDRLEILQGVEMAEYLHDPKNADRILSLGEFDVILGSVHSVAFEDIDDSYSRIDFSSMPEEKIIRFMKKYFFHISEMIDKTDFDVLSHLTCPLRYINGKYERNIDVHIFKKEILSILDEIIRRDIPLEINTSGLGSFYRQYMPDVSLIRTYKAMGGRLVTLASDAHVPQNVGNAFSDAKAILQDIGLDSYCIFRKRTLFERDLKK
jgi:histidinol-phosphatase (PHP family)